MDGYSGSLNLVPAIVKRNRPNTNELYQNSMMAALFQGIYDGDIDYGELAKHGDFGVGTFDALDGEMVAFDGKFFRLKADGTVSPVSADTKSPFAMLTFFAPDMELVTERAVDRADFEALVKNRVEANSFFAIRARGRFSEITTRTVTRQHKPYPPLPEATQNQVVNRFQDIEGTLAGFLSPAFTASGLGVPGFHLHFVDGSEHFGGHALDYVIEPGCRVAIAPEREFHIHLPHLTEFSHADLDDPKIRAGIHKAEG